MRGTPLWTDQERRALARRLRFVIGQAQGLALTQAARETLATSENTRHQRGGRAPGRLGWGPVCRTVEERPVRQRFWKRR